MTKSRVQGIGEMADRIRAHPWRETSLGPIEQWPGELVATVNMMLASRVIAALYWGPARIMLYNDLYTPQLAEKHPALGCALGNVWPEVHEKVEAILSGTYQTGQSSLLENVSFQVSRRGAQVGKIYTLMTDPIWCETPEGPRVLGLYHTAIDQTAGLQAAREKQRVSEQLTQVLEVTSDAIVSVDRDWVMTYMNPKAEQLYGPVSQLVGRRVWDAFPDAVYAGSPFLEHYYRAMDEGIAGSFEAQYPEPLNLWLRLDVYPTRDGIVTFSRDITQEKRTAAALLQTEKLAAVGRLAASIAHEINNPLESVTNLLYLVRGSKNLEEIAGYTETAERELRRVSIITNQTLRFYKQSTRPIPMFCHDLIGESLSVYQGRLVNSRITIEKRKRAEQPVTCFDGEIRQVLSNLIGNAIDAMPLGGRLLVRSREATHWETGERGLVLTVADTGTGMTRDVQRKIFEPFYTTKGIGGTGLGLWVSSEIVRRHRGSLRVRSTPGAARSGTVFVLFLPFRTAERTPEAEASYQGPVQSPGRLPRSGQVGSRS